MQRKMPVFLKPMLLGEKKDNLEDEVKIRYHQMAGIIHILVISDFPISVLGLDFDLLKRAGFWKCGLPG